MSKRKDTTLDKWLSQSSNDCNMSSGVSVSTQNVAATSTDKEFCDKESNLEPKTVSDGHCPSDLSDVEGQQITIVPGNFITCPTIDVRDASGSITLSTRIKVNELEPHQQSPYSAIQMKEPHQPNAMDEEENPPPQQTQGRSFKFQFQWYKIHPWIHYDPTLRKIVCHTCSNAKLKGLFSSSMKIEDAFTTIGYGNWKNGKENLRKHELSLQHKEAVTKLLSVREIPISKKLSDATLKSQADARAALKAIFTTVIYLGKQGLALRGSESDSGNFISLLHLRADDLSQLKSWLLRSSSKTYTSGEIQNAILETVAHSVLRSILPVIHAAQFFSVIVDETTDIAVHEQVSLSVRIVNENLEAHEYFLGLYNTASTTGEILSTLLLDSLQRFNLPLENLRGQCYDGASNMSGKFRGVQSRILDLQRKAVYVHCFNHSLNLALQDTISKNVFFRDLLANIHEIGIVLKGSPSRVAKFEEIAGKNDPAILRPHPLCPTRWTVRVRSINAVLKSYTALIELFDEIAKSSDKVASKAAGLHTQLEKGEFYLGLLMARNLFDASECLSKILQTPTASVSGGIEAATLTIKRLLSFRSDDKFNEHWTTMGKQVVELSLQEPVLPRMRKKPKRLESNPSEIPFESPESRLKHIYFEAINLMCEEIGRRFDQPGLHLYEKLETAFVKPVPDNAAALMEVCTFYDWDFERLTNELLLLRDNQDFKWTTTSNVVDGFRSLSPESKLLFPLINEYLKHLLVIPCSSAGAERSFSRLRRIKSYLRSTMGQSRLNHCCIINFYPDVVDSLNLDEMLQSFIEERNRQPTFGNFVT